MARRVAAFVVNVLAVLVTMLAPRTLAAQAPSITLIPSPGSYTSAALTLTVDFCAASGSLNQYSIDVEVNGAPQNAFPASFIRSPLPGCSDHGRATAVVTLSSGANSISAFICTNAFNCGSVVASYTLTSSPAYIDVDLSFTNFDNQDASLCAVGCFTAMYAQSTVPYWSLDTPRNVTLIYNGDRVANRPFVYADVRLANGYAGTPALAGYQLQVQDSITGGLIPFTNGDTILRFQPSATPIFARRLSGQLNLNGFATGVRTVRIVATAVYATGVRDSKAVLLRLPIWNPSTSYVARGWSIAGVQRFVMQSDSSLLMLEGDGSLSYFARCGAGCYASPQGDYSKIWPSGGLIYRSYPDSTRAVFDAVAGVGRLLRVISPSKADTVSYEYDGSAQQRLTRIYDPYRTTGGATHTYSALSYGPTGLSSIAEPGSTGAPGAGRTTTVSVSSDSTLAFIRDPDLVSTTFTYDAVRRLRQITNRRGDATRFVYKNATWKLDSIVQPAIPIDVGGGSTALQSPAFVFAPWQTVGVPLATTAIVQAPTLDPYAQNQGSVTDPGGHVTFVGANRWGQPTVITEADGYSTVITRSGVLATARWVAGIKDSVAYVGSLPTWIQRAGAPPTLFRYSAGYAVPDSIWGTNAPGARIFVSGGRVDSTRVGAAPGAAGLMTRYGYDTRNRVTYATDPLGHTTAVFYDAMSGNQDSVLAPGRGMRTPMDPFGRVSAVSISGQPTLRVWYDTLNRVRRVHDGVSADTTLYGYDALYPTRVQDARANHQLFRVDVNALGRVTRRYDPADTLSRFLTYLYDKDGNVTSWTNRRGERLTLKYDALHRLVSKSGANATSDSLWYSSDRMQVVGINAYARDEVYRASGSSWIDSVVTTINGNRFRRWYRPDNLLRLDSLAVSSSAGITLAGQRQFWSATNGLLDSIRVGGANVGIARNAEWLTATTTYPGGTTRALQYSTIHGVNSSIYSGALDTSFTRLYASDTLARISAIVAKRTAGYSRDAFTYDGRGFLSAIARSAPSCANIPVPDWGYLCGVAAVTEQWTHQYDAVGNRTRDSYATAPLALNYDVTNSYGGANRVSVLPAHRTVAGVPSQRQFEYDLDGQIIRAYDINPLTSAIGGDHRYTWSADARLTGDSISASNYRLGYVYNAFGQLIARKVNGSVDRWFLWDRDQLMAELNATGTTRVAQYSYWPGVDEPLSLVTGATTITTQRYFAQDEIGNVIGVFVGSTPSQRIAYDAWGNASSVTGSLADTSRLRWKGLMWAGDSAQLYYVRNRWYDPAQGRFMSEDPIGVAGGINQYAFVASDPINGEDPSGLIGDRGFCDGRPGCTYGAPRLPRGKAKGTGVGQWPGSSGQRQPHEFDANDGSAVLGKLQQLAPAIQHELATFLPTNAAWAAGGLVTGNLAQGVFNAVRGQIVTVVHYTSVEGAAAIEASGALRAGSYVALPAEVGVRSASSIESFLEIQSGKGAMRGTFRVSANLLETPFNGPYTSGGATQYQILRPIIVRAGAFRPVP